VTEDPRRTDSRVADMAHRFERPVLIATVLVVPALIVETNSDSDNLREAASLLNWLI
jgi:hypothetical protein